ncbi:MAG: LLM class flavin-dependent oxidoreductase [Ilumatobacteraceae bacterium]
MANRAMAAAEAMGRSGFTLGIGPSHEPVIEGMYGLSFEHPGRHMEEYVAVLAPMLRGEAVSFEGDEYRVHLPASTPPAQPVQLMLGALAPRYLRIAGQQSAGTILWMGNARAIEGHVAPRLRQATGDGAEPRIVAGLPVVVHDDIDEARNEAAKQFAVYGTLPNYLRLMAHGGIQGPAEAAIVGNEAAVRGQLQALFDAGATDIWAAPFSVGTDRKASRDRTMALLRELVAS